MVFYDSDEARYFALAADYRRSGVYCALGAILFVVLAVWIVKPLVPNRPGAAGDPTHFTVLGLVLLGAAGLCFFLFRWRLRVDRRGIARRRFFRWHLWPWDAFRAEQVGYGPGLDRYVWPQAPFGQRWLSLGLLEEADREELRELIRAVWVPPPEPELPEQLTIHYGLGNTATLAPGGIAIKKRRRRCDYRWDEVMRLTIIVHEHGRRDFERLEIHLPGQSITWYVHEGNRSWRGPAAEVIARFVRQYVPEDRTLVVAMHGPPRSTDEADFRVRYWQSKRRGLGRFKYAFAALVATFAVLYAAGLARIGHLVFALLWSAMSWLVYRFIDRTMAREEAKIEPWLQQAEADLPPIAGERPT